MNWQPIDTAPKDGSRFLAWCPTLAGPKMNIIRWRPLDDDSAFTWQANDNGRIHRYQPTHWMLIPEPPNTLGTLGENEEQTKAEKP